VPATPFQTPARVEKPGSGQVVTTDLSNQSHVDRSHHFSICQPGSPPADWPIRSRGRLAHLACENVAARALLFRNAIT